MQGQAPASILYHRNKLQTRTIIRVMPLKTLRFLFSRKLFLRGIFWDKWNGRGRVYGLGFGKYQLILIPLPKSPMSRCPNSNSCAARCPNNCSAPAREMASSSCCPPGLYLLRQALSSSVTDSPVHGSSSPVPSQVLQSCGCPTLLPVLSTISYQPLPLHP